MKLYIVRHGLAIERGAPQCPSDPERFLTEAGWSKTRQVAKRVAALAEEPDLLISSPYIRAMQTAEIFAEQMGYPKEKIHTTQSLLPGTDPLQLFRELARLKDETNVFVFGHAPQLDYALAYALGSKQPVTELKKAGVALLELKRVSPPLGKLVWLAPPKLLRPAKK